MLTRVRKRCECLADASCLLWVLVLVMWVRSCVSKATAHGRALSPSPYPVGDALRGTRSVFNTGVDAANGSPRSHARIEIGVRGVSPFACVVSFEPSLGPLWSQGLILEVFSSPQHIYITWFR